MLDARSPKRHACNTRVMRTPSYSLCLSVRAWPAFAEAPKPLVLENLHFRYTISAAARNVEFVDRATGTNYLRATEVSSCARVRVQGKEYSATAATLADDRLKLRFGRAGVTVILRTEAHPSCIIFSVESVSGREVES